MKNNPRIFIDADLAVGGIIPLAPDVVHYLTRVMRTDKFIAFGNGVEFNAVLENGAAKILSATGRADAGNNLTLAFAPIKQSRLEEMLNMATQLGVARLQPVITDRVNEHHINWNRIKKIIVEASEQSNRNSVPELLAPVKFSDFVAANKNIVFADERFAHDDSHYASRLTPDNGAAVLIGPEGGFSDAEFAALHNAGAAPMSLGPTILRAETAAAVAIAKITDNV